MFEKAAKEKLRFPYKGLITVEDLFDLSVIELDKVYKNLHAKLKVAKEESLLNTKTKEDSILDLQLQIVKHIFDEKVQKAEAAKLKKLHKEEKEKIMKILAMKQDQALQEKTPEELQKMLAEFSVSDDGQAEE
jgi:uncharacterized Fe-S cluster-containing radical SAM superfamily protein